VGAGPAGWIGLKSCGCVISGLNGVKEFRVFLYFPCFCGFLGEYFDFSHFCVSFFCGLEKLKN
jgi:hypothetical protein